MAKKPPSGASATDTASAGPGSTIAIGATHGALTFALRVTPRANRDALALEDGQLRARLRAAPVEGAANAALIALLAERLGLPRRAFTIIQGETARIKRIAVTGVSEDNLRQRIAVALT